MFNLTLNGILQNYNGNIFDCELKKKYSAAVIKELVAQNIKKLLRAGIQEGDVVAVSLKHSFPFLINFFSLALLKVSQVLLTGGLKESEIAATHRDVHLNWIINNPDQNDAADVLVNTLDDYSFYIRNISDSKKIKADEVYIIQPTSGSTGNVKYCVKDEKRVIADAVNYIESIGIDNPVNLLNCLPLNHAYALGFSLLISFIVSADLFLFDVFNPRKVAKLFCEHLIDIFPTIPVYADLLTKIKIPDSGNIPALIYTAGSILEHKISQKFHNAYKTVLRPLFGATEVGGISLERENIVSENGNAGVKLKYTNVKLIEDKDTKCYTILIDTPSKMIGYLNNDGTIDKSALQDDFWFPTHDICRIEADDRIRILGRLKNIINIFGFKVDPFEVRNVINSMPGISDSHVYAGKNNAGSDFVYAMIELTDKNIQKTHIIDFAKKHLTDKKVLSKLFIVDKIPRTSTGKIIKEHLLF